MIEDLKNVINQGEFKKRSFFSFRFLIVLGFLLFLFGLLGVFLGSPLLKIKNRVENLNKEVKGIAQVVQSQDLNQTEEKVKRIKNEVSLLTKDFKKIKWIKIFPLLGRFYKDGERVINAGNYLIEAGEIAINEIKPYADFLGLKKEEEEEKGSLTIEERLMMALETLDKVSPAIDQIEEKLKKAEEELEKIKPANYPQKIFSKEIRKKIEEAQKLVRNTSQMVEEIKPILKYLKPLLGYPHRKQYLLLFQNDAELRPTGGFLTAYAILEVDKGNFKPLGSWDIYTLDARFGNRLPPPDPIKKYHKNVFYWYLRDMNLSPDFKVFIETFWPYYQRAGGSNVDGIIALDTKVLVDLLRVLGPIGVAEWGRYSAENDPRCNCPQVIYELEKQITKPVGTLRTERKAVLGPLMHSILLNIMQSPRKKWPEFINIFFENIREKDILFYFFDEELQKAIETLNAGGRIREWEGDYLHINDSNFAGAKSNMFIKVNVSQEIEIGRDGEVTKTVVIDYKNPAPPSNCNLEVGELCLNGLYRDWVRVYVPQGSKLIEISGSEVEAIVYDELGKTVFEAFFGNKAPLRPLGKAQLRFKYKLPFTIDKEYRLLIQKQPGTHDYEYQIKLGGREENFVLLTDKEFVFSLQ